MSRTSKRLRFLVDNAEYVTIERVAGTDRYRVSIGGDEWQGIAEECDGDTLGEAIREAVRTVERADTKRARRKRGGCDDGSNQGLLGGVRA